MNIFNELNYRKIIKDIVEERKKIDNSINFQAMAQYMNIQKAYLSQVIKDKRDLSQDQLFSASLYLKLTDIEYEYMQLLLEYERSGIKIRRDELLKLIKEMQKKYSKTSKHINVNEINIDAKELQKEYYLDPINQLVHIALSIKEFRDEPLKLSEHLLIPKEKVKAVIIELEKMKVIVLKDGRVIDTLQNIHLPRSSPLFYPWKVALNNHCINKVKFLDEADSYNMSACFSADEKSRKEVHKLFMEFLNKAKTKIDQSSDKNLYQINFDLFRWT